MAGDWLGGSGQFVAGLLAWPHALLIRVTGVRRPRVPVLAPFGARVLLMEAGGSI